MARPGVQVARHVGGLLSADGRHDHDTSYRVHVARMHVPALPKLALWGWGLGRRDGCKALD